MSEIVIFFFPWRRLRLSRLLPLMLRDRRHKWRWFRGRRGLQLLSPRGQRYDFMAVRGMGTFIRPESSENTRTWRNN